MDIGFKGTFTQTGISFPTVYCMTIIENLEFLIIYYIDYQSNPIGGVTLIMTSDLHFLGINDIQTVG